jgi:hypothetical protein
MKKKDSLNFENAEPISGSSHTSLGFRGAFVGSDTIKVP